MRRRSILETWFELREARLVRDEWYVWGSCSLNGDLDAVVRRLEDFANGALLRKNGDFLSLYSRGKYLHEEKVLDLLSEWRRFCCDFQDMIRRAKG